ncbi:hypothetical protein GMDG_00717 [Pseudogymnoascus destructans 20631-21]|uniref:Transmembrane protein n=1 Tax=Pseudogymnoascus destructans (strain ATCC MYA-4855 / 20631-21) TaxID=658429 RepID=L8GAN3_PSED2|nr:hypothetical protein GMDG_00717 [Pseudogymnoascus destructans 20631-21]
MILMIRGRGCLKVRGGDLRRWSAWFLRFSLRIFIIAVRRRAFGCFIFFFWIASVFFGLDMLVVFFWGLWVASVLMVGGRADGRVITFYMCSFICLFWWNTEWN